MSVLSLCQGVADYIGLNSPTAIIGQNTKDARRFRAAVRREVKWLMTQQWPDLLRVGTITFDGSDLYDLPSDNFKLVGDTFWTDLDRFSAGPIHPQLFQRLVENGVVTVDPVFRFQQSESGTVKKQMRVYPTQASGSKTFLYYSNAPFTNAAGSSRLSVWTADTDLPILEEHVLELGVTWRMLASLRRQFSVEFQEWKQYTDERLAAATLARTIDISHTRRHPIANTPETGFG